MDTVNKPSTVHKHPQAKSPLYIDPRPEPHGIYKSPYIYRPPKNERPQIRFPSSIYGPPLNADPRSDSIKITDQKPVPP